MADQNQNQDDRSLNASQSGDQRDQQSGRQAQNQNQNNRGEQDDVAEDRNLSGSSTWLNLPDQPKGDQSSDESDGRQSNR